MCGGYLDCAIGNGANNRLSNLLQLLEEIRRTRPAFTEDVVIRVAIDVVGDDECLLFGDLPHDNPYFFKVVESGGVGNFRIR